MVHRLRHQRDGTNGPAKQREEGSQPQHADSSSKSAQRRAVALGSYSQHDSLRDHDGGSRAPPRSASLAEREAHERRQRRQLGHGQRVRPPPQMQMRRAAADAPSPRRAPHQDGGARLAGRLATYPAPPNAWGSSGGRAIREHFPFLTPTISQLAREPSIERNRPPPHTVPMELTAGRALSAALACGTHEAVVAVSALTEADGAYAKLVARERRHRLDTCTMGKEDAPVVAAADAPTDASLSGECIARGRAADARPHGYFDDYNDYSAAYDDEYGSDGGDRDDLRA